MNKLLIVTIANDKNIYEEFVRNLNSQNGINFKLVTVYNYNNEFSSAVQAYNSILSNLDSDFVLFTHPDIRFLDEFSLRDIVSYVDRYDDFGVIGIAGAPEIFSINPIVFTSIVQGNKKESIGVSIASPTPVQTLDECFFIIKSKNLKKTPLEEIDGTEHIKNKWHLHCVNYCLKMIKNGKTNYVVPSRVWHISDGQGGNWDDYICILERMIDNEKNYFDIIYTTVKAWRTRGIGAYLYRKYYILKKYLKRLFNG